MNQINLEIQKQYIPLGIRIKSWELESKVEPYYLVF